MKCNQTLAGGAASNLLLFFEFHNFHNDNGRGPRRNRRPAPGVGSRAGVGGLGRRKRAEGPLFAAGGGLSLGGELKSLDLCANSPPESCRPIVSPEIWGPRPPAPFSDSYFGPGSGSGSSAHSVSSSESSAGPASNHWRVHDLFVGPLACRPAQ